jgi:hypothetical protein
MQPAPRKGTASLPHAPYLVQNPPWFVLCVLSAQRHLVHTIYLPRVTTVGRQAKAQSVPQAMATNGAQAGDYMNRSKRSFLALQMGHISGGSSRAQR